MRRSFIQLHIAVFLAGFTGILGRLITLNEGLLVWWRLLLTAGSLWVLAYFENRKKTGGRFGPVPSRVDILRITGIGAVAALHWVSFYGSIKYSNVSVALVCFSAVGFFTAILEPLIFRRRPDFVEILLGLLVIAGIAFIFRFDPHYKKGILIGLVSALLGSLFPILNKAMLGRVAPSTLTLYELTGGWVSLSLLLPCYMWIFSGVYSWPSTGDWGWLLVLSWLCTVLAFRLSMNALKKVSAFTVNLSYNLEPVYGILLAFWVYREDRGLNAGFYAGFACVMLAVVLQMVRLWWLRKKG